MAKSLTKIMLGIENLPAFVGTAILLSLTPGPDTLYIVGRSVAQGRPAGITSVLGVSSGMIVHTFVGAFGLSAILATSATAFMVVKYLGAVYLIYQGIQMFFVKTKGRQDFEPKFEKYKLSKIYRQGAITNIVNPKAAVFFLAFLPQFISDSCPNKFFAFITLGLLLIIVETIWYLILAIFSAYLSKPFRKNTSLSNWLNRINGVVFSYLGLKLATMNYPAA